MKRSVSVKMHFRKGRPVRKHDRSIFSRKNKITKKKRRVFTALAKEPFETGGQLDFEDGELDNARLHFGSNSAVEFPYDPDLEATWHTHPPEKGSSVFPSTDDILTMRDNREREGLIFNKRMAISIYEGDKFQESSHKQIKDVFQKIDKDFYKGMPDKELVEKYKPLLKKELGLSIKLHNPDKDIPLETYSR